uniref:Putative single strand-specific nuclease n=1 Tax=Trypanosoma congolense (strain IL3000) TaxID=1068625 RepID=G0UNN8_TRYCI|nr:putative single strand-specific nuclease [Trypanosoma congolense IL3000]
MMRFVSPLCPLLLIVASLLPLHASGWWGFGHMVVAEIARRNLDEKIMRTLENYTQHLSMSGPFPEIPDFVQSACWPDDLKGYNLRVMNGWHFTDNIYIRGNFTPENITKQKSNVVSVIDSLSNTLKRTDTPIYVRSFALAHLVHYYGDIHQPLHTTSMMSNDFPHGDLGGNLIRVSFRGHHMNLHALWDSICQGEQKQLKRPLSPESYAKVISFADRLVATYNFSREEKELTSPAAISKEGYALAKAVAYKNVEDNTILNESYIENCVKTAEERVTLAGYRLATQLTKIFKRKRKSSKGHRDDSIYASPL